VPYLEPPTRPLVGQMPFAIALLLVSSGLAAEARMKGERGRRRADGERSGDTGKERSRRELLKLASQRPDAMRPYDLRRTFANWMEGAGIPRTRRRIYRGHEARDMGDLYEWHGVRAFLSEDAAKLRVFIGPMEAPALQPLRGS
jgi:integrase